MSADAMIRGCPAENLSAEALTPDQERVSDTGPEERATVNFETLFKLDEIQRIQDEFSAATGVASLITCPDGTPLTKPSNFTKLCSEIIRKTEQGCANCYKSDALIGRYNPNGPIVQTCMSGGLWDAGVSITVDGHHIANWLVGQVRDETQTNEEMRAYAHSIGAEESSFMEAFEAVPAMSRERFTHVARALFTLANQLSTKAFLNVQQQQAIAELQVLQMNMQDSETYNKILFADSYIALVVMDPSTGTIIDCNEAALEIYQLPSRDAMIGLTPLDVSAPRQYDGTESELAARYHIDQALSKGSHVFEWRQRLKDGQEWDAEVHLMSFEHDGRTLLQLSVQDITERNKVREALRASEENLSITLHSIGDAVITTDATGLVSRMNATAERLSGWTLADALGRPLVEVFRIVNAETRESVPDPVQLVMAHGQVVGLANHTVLLARDGKEYQIADSAAPIRSANGEILGVVLVFSDVSDQYRAEQALRDSEKRFKALHDASFGGISIHEKGVILDCNQGLSNLTGFSKDELVGMNGLELIAHEWRDGVMQNIDSGVETSYEVEGLRKDGTRYPMSIQGKNIPYQGRSVRVTEFRDITDLKLADEALRMGEKRYHAIFDTSLDAININRLSDGLCIDANQSFFDIQGYVRDEVIGRTAPELGIWFDPVERQRYVELVHRDSRCENIEARFKTKNGELIWGLLSASVVELDGVPCIISIRRDITERKQAEEKINQLAFFDQLTGLPNRTLLQDRLKQAMASSLRSGRHGALLLIDLDYFKTLNDTLGHDMGDLLLKQVAQRLVECVREEDTVARLGGDEFVVLLVSLSDSQSEAATVVELIGGKITAALNQSYDLKGIVYGTTPSVGASVFLGQQNDIDTLLKQADLAMYKAKDAGRNTLRFFDPDMTLDVLKRASLNKELREALQKNQFVLHYQAQVSGSQVTGAEALLRWQHPELGLVFPGDFISVIEETGLILPVGQWVLEMACKQLADWALQPEMSHLTVAVNISARQLNHEDFVDQVLMTLDRSGANPRRLKLELTESLLVRNVEDIIGKMTVLKEKGVGFSLDDFGTGYSSLSYLKRLPLDQLKIDQSFVRDLLTDPNDAAIAKMIVVLAETLGLVVIAEGVETEAQKDSLTQQGCHAFQGYLFSRPLPLDCFEIYAHRFFLASPKTSEIATIQ